MLLDKTQLKQSFSAASSAYDALAVLQREVGLRLLQSAEMKSGYRRIIDLGCGTGFISANLNNENRHYQITALDIAYSMLSLARRQNGLKNIHYICGDAENLPLLDDRFDAVFSNVALQWCQDLPQALSELYRVLSPGGDLFFSTFGLGTLSELKSAWSEVDDYTHVNDFVSTEQLADLLSVAGFENIDIRVEDKISHYDSVMELMKELKGIGAHNVTVGRKKRLTTRGQLQKMIQAYPKRADGGIVASYRVIYVNAVKLL